ncbi:hypothetical protein [Cellvibrio mixtus]|uniref:hypothetical protein n=1 Tax=Cellvibrio mixtus TaxID=39650 RepID=UPI0005875B5C|nr:hypothetical protein [Cellvibrio mixtus]
MAGLKTIQQGAYLLALSIKSYRANHKHYPRTLIDEMLASDLALFVEMAVRVSLFEAHNNGKSGWWIEEECTIENLEKLLEKAINNKDYISIINYSAMIYARNNVDGKQL